MKKVNVSAAVIVKDNKYYCKRNKDKHLGGYYEFPGGNKMIMKL